MRLLTALATLALAACTAGNGYAFLQRDNGDLPTPERLPVCYGFGCRNTAVVDASVRWPEVAALFADPPTDADGERIRVAEAVALLERIAADSAPIGTDLGGTFTGLGLSGQLDCVDEATNTTRFLVVLGRAGLLRFHIVGSPSTRGVFVGGWPHQTAVLIERATGVSYAVDSWFRDNGKPAAVVTLDLWQTGWRPADGAAN